MSGSGLLSEHSHLALLLPLIKMPHSGHFNGVFGGVSLTFLPCDCWRECSGRQELGIAGLLKIPLVPTGGWQCPCWVMAVSPLGGAGVHTGCWQCPCWMVAVSPLGWWWCPYTVMEVSLLGGGGVPACPSGSPLGGSSGPLMARHSAELEKS